MSGLRKKHRYVTLSKSKDGGKNPEFSIGQEVLVKKTGATGIIESKATWGDYVLEGSKGIYYSPAQLEPT
jgi:hypothetical protein